MPGKDADEQPAEEADAVCVQKADGSGFRFSAQDAAQFMQDHEGEGYQVVPCDPDEEGSPTDQLPKAADQAASKDDASTKKPRP